MAKYIGKLQLASGDTLVPDIADCTLTLSSTQEVQSFVANGAQMKIYTVYFPNTFYQTIFNVSGVNGLGLAFIHTSTIADFIFFDTTIRICRYNAGTWSRKAQWVGTGI